jgi:hypothetical protein
MVKLGELFGLSPGNETWLAGNSTSFRNENGPENH